MTEDIVLNGILGAVIPNYEDNSYTYHWIDITPSDFDSHAA